MPPASASSGLDHRSGAERGGCARARAISLGVLATGALLILLTRSDAIQIADSGELVAAACEAGVPHPPGYPLFVLLGHPLCQLPFSTPAGRVGLLSLLAGLLALALVLEIVRRSTGSAWAGAVAAIALAAGSAFWRQASQAEVFALNVALALAVVYASLRATQASSAGGQAGWCALAGLAAGLALSNHHSSLLVTPLVAVAVLLPFRSVGRAALRGLLALGGLAAGLLPYLYLLLADRTSLPRWGDTSTLEGLLAHVLRRDYSSSRLAIYGEPAGLQNLGHFLSRVPSQLGWVLSLAALAGVAVLLGRAAARPLGRTVEGRLGRGLAAGLVLVPVLSGPAFFLLFNIAPEGIGAQVVERFHVLPTALLAVCLGVGIAAIEEQLLSSSASRLRLWRAGVASLLVLTALLAYPKADLRQSYTVEDWARNALSSVERDALIAGTGDVQLFSILYAQQVLGLRPDVQFVNVRLLAHSWYVAQKRRERPSFAYEYSGRRIQTVGWLQGELKRGVPVYLAGPYFSERAARAFAGHPTGPLLRLLPPGVLPPPPAQVAELNARLFRGFADRGRRPQPAHDPWAASLLESYAQSWRSIAAALAQVGDRRGALRALARANSWAPWLPVPDWLENQRARQR